MSWINWNEVSRDLAAWKARANAAGSWWADCPRDEWPARVEAELPRMRMGSGAQIVDALHAASFAGYRDRDTAGLPKHGGAMPGYRTLGKEIR